MMKQFLTASAIAVLAASPAFALSTKAPTGTGGSHVRIDDASGGYTANGQYIRPHDRIGTSDPFWRVNPVTGSAALAFAPVAGAFGYDTGYGGGYDSYAYAPGAGVLGMAPVIEDGKYLGADPDANVRLQLRRGAVQYQ